MLQKKTTWDLLWCFQRSKNLQDLNSIFSLKKESKIKSKLWLQHKPNPKERLFTAHVQWIFACIKVGNSTACEVSPQDSILLLVVLPSETNYNSTLLDDIIHYNMSFFFFSWDEFPNAFQNIITFPIHQNCGKPSSTSTAIRKIFIFILSHKSNVTFKIIIEFHHKFNSDFKSHINFEKT